VLTNEGNVAVVDQTGTTFGDPIEHVGTANVGFLANFEILTRRDRLGRFIA